MGIFSQILGKLGINKPAAAPAGAPATPQATAPVAQPAPAQPAPTAISPVDVGAKLDALAASSAEKLNWKVSIVDLLKLLGIDNSLSARKDLAIELGCPTDKMKDTADMNMWLHKTVLQKLAANGGQVPKELLD